MLLVVLKQLYDIGPRMVLRYLSTNLEDFVEVSKLSGDVFVLLKSVGCMQEVMRQTIF